MIKINYDKCNGCGLCVKICHESCIELRNGEINIDYNFCSTCTQCIAVCPCLAISWDNDEPIPFDNNLLPSATQLEELFKQRRTKRFFKERKPAKKLLEEIVSYGVYAMTKGLGCRNLVGNQMFLNRNKKLRTILGLGKNEKIYATMGIGYPSIKFRNKVIGKKMDIQWNNITTQNMQ